MNSKGFADWLASRRKDLELTQEQLAKRAGCEKAYISKFESPPAGQPAPMPSLEFLVKLARGLEVSIVEPLKAMGFVKPEIQTEPHILRLINYYRALPPSEQKLAEKLVKTLWQERGLKPAQPQPKRKRA